MTVIIPTEQQHIPAVATLLAEMDRFYGDSTAPPDEQHRQIAAALFGNPPAEYALIAREQDQLIGFAAYSFLWPAVGVTRSLYLKELYVTETHRKTGVGKQLMQAIFAVAVERQCSRVEWATDQFNINAQEFYAFLGHRPHQGKVNYRVELG